MSGEPGTIAKAFHPAVIGGNPLAGFWPIPNPTPGVLTPPGVRCEPFDRPADGYRIRIIARNTFKISFIT